MKKILNTISIIHSLIVVYSAVNTIPSLFYSWTFDYCLYSFPYIYFFLIILYIISIVIDLKKENLRIKKYIGITIINIISLLLILVKKHANKYR
jgi:hypothetical protein